MNSPGVHCVEDEPSLASFIQRGLAEEAYEIIILHQWEHLSLPLSKLIQRQR